MGMANSQHFSALHAQRRMREAQNGTAGTAAQQQKHAQQWSAWFRHELENEDGLYKAIGESLANQRREIRAEFEPLLIALKEENEELKDRIKHLETQQSLNARFAELERGFAARQLALNERKRGAQGLKGARGEKGERGLRGEKGDPGKAAEPVYIVNWQVDRQGYRASPVYSNGHVGGVLEVREFYQQFLADRGED